MNCSKCGFDNKQDAIYCEQCGSKLLTDISNPNRKKSLNFGGKRKVKKTVIYSLLILTLVILCGGGFFIVHNISHNSISTNTETGSDSNFYFKKNSTFKYYDLDGNITSIQKTEYNQFGNIVKDSLKSDDLNVNMEFLYDEDGKLLVRKWLFDTGKTREDILNYTSNIKGQQIGSVYSSDGTLATQYIYNSENQLVEIVEFDGLKETSRTKFDEKYLPFQRIKETYTESDNIFFNYNDTERSITSERITYEAGIKHTYKSLIRYIGSYPGIVCERTEYTDGQLSSSSVITEDTRSDPNGHLKYENKDAKGNLINYVVLTYKGGKPFTWEQFEADDTLLTQNKYDENANLIESRSYQDGKLYSEAFYEWGLRNS